MAGMEFVPRRDEALIAELGRALGVAIPDRTLSQLAAFAELVVRWNRKLDLTAARTPAALVEVLMADALMLSDGALVPESSYVLDVGSGAGAPVLPLLVLRSDLIATLVEPLHKRATFLRTTLARLQLSERAVVRETRVDPSAPEAPGGAHDVALSRATFSPERWLSVGLTLAPRTLVFLASAEPPLPREGSRLAEVRRYRLPWSDAPRCLACYLRE